MLYNVLCPKMRCLYNTVMMTSMQLKFRVVGRSVEYSHNTKEVPRASCSYSDRTLMCSKGVEECRLITKTDVAKQTSQ